MSCSPVLLAAVGFAICSAMSAHAQPDSAASAHAVEAYFREQMRIAHIPSVSVAVVRGGLTELLQSYGTANLEWGAAATPRTAYPLASATKPLTGTALLALVEDGILSLDDPVTDYVTFAPEAWDAITLRHLATHSSGISDDLGPGAPADAEEATRRVTDRPLVFEPGTQSSYGIGGYGVLQYVIEQATGQTFPEVLRARVLDPLGMADTRFDHATNDGPFREADVVPERAGVYAWNGEAQRIFWFHFGSEAYTAGGLLSTAADLARWAAALDTGRLLSDEGLRQMWGSAGDLDAFGVGWVRGTYRGRRTVGHSGGPALADILRFPDEQLTIIVLANQSRLYPYLAQGVADLLVPSVPEEEPTTLSDDDSAVTARVERLLRTLADGEVIEDAFTEEARTAFVPQLRSFLLSYTRSLGVPTSVRLIEDGDRDRRRRVYRATYGEKVVDWSFELAPNGAIIGMGPTAR